MELVHFAGKLFICVVFLLITPMLSFAQISMASSSGSASQNFDTLKKVVVTWTDNKTKVIELQFENQEERYKILKIGEY